MKRFKITNELRNKIKNSSYSINKLSQKANFRVKNIYRTNISINENHLNILKSILNINPNLKEIKLNYIKNLGKHAISPPIKQIKKSKKLAEFIGIMLGDGNIYRDTIKISLDKRNKIYTNYIENLTKKVFPIKLKKRFAKKANRIDLYYYNQNLVKQLLKLGLKRGNKIKNQLGIPKWIKKNKEFSKACIKGLIDTDGCISFDKRPKQKYKFINFTNHNQQLFNDFKEVTKNLGYSFAKSNNTNTRLNRKLEVVNFINSIKPFKDRGAVG